jgi:hypothetical protein
LKALAESSKQLRTEELSKIEEADARLKACVALEQQRQAELLQVDRDTAALRAEVSAEEDAMQQQEKAWLAEEVAANRALQVRRSWLAKNRGIARQKMKEAGLPTKVARLNSTASFSQVDLVDLEDSATATVPQGSPALETAPDRSQTAPLQSGEGLSEQEMQEPASHEEIQLQARGVGEDSVAMQSRDAEQAKVAGEATAEALGATVVAATAAETEAPATAAQAALGAAETEAPAIAAEAIVIAEPEVRVDANENAAAQVALEERFVEDEGCVVESPQAEIHEVEAQAVHAVEVAETLPAEVEAHFPIGSRVSAATTFATRTGASIPEGTCGTVETTVDDSGRLKIDFDDLGLRFIDKSSPLRLLER